ncbi:MAG: CpaF family protein [Eubacterium sp.]|nr:CpaF family protein [Eubacterium sp.]
MKIDQALSREGAKTYIGLRDRIELKKSIYNSIKKLDVLSDLLEDNEITEIMINGPDSIFIEKNGIIKKADLKFESKERLSTAIQQIVSTVNRQVNQSEPIQDAILQDGSRVNIVLSGISCDGDIVTVRKFSKERITIEQLIENEAITKEAAEFLKLVVKAKYNIFISGGTGTGKTTFLNALTEFIPPEERVITIEDSAELKIQGIDNLVRLQAKNKNVEGKNSVNIRDLVRNSLRMRPDRIIVGEVRGGEAADMITAMLTGHEGSLSTGHSNSVRDTFFRLETMVMMSGMELPILAIRQQIASAINIVVHLGRLRDKSRRVLEISEVTGISNGEIMINPIYSFRESGEENGRVKGRLELINKLLLVDKLSSYGLIKIYMEGYENEKKDQEKRIS